MLSLFVAAVPAFGLSAVVRVPHDYATISEALAESPDYAIIDLAAGVYPETLVVSRPVVLRGDAAGGVVIMAPDDLPAIEVRDTEGVTIEGLTVVGGEYGIFVTRSQDVTVRDNHVSDSRLTGIKVRLGAADIIGNTVSNVRPPYGMGIHVTNTTQWPESRVIANIVNGNATSGIYTNMTGMITIEDNIVRDNGEHGIAVTEMSHADVIGNLVDDNAHSGIRLLDMSMAKICENIITDTQSDSGEAGMRQGNGIIVDYHSDAILSSNTIFGSEQNGISVLYASNAWVYENNLEQPLYADESVIHDGHGCEADH